MIEIGEDVGGGVPFEFRGLCKSAAYLLISRQLSAHRALESDVATTMDPHPVSSLYIKLRIECLCFGPYLFGGFLAACTRELSSEQYPTNTVALKCERFTDELKRTPCGRDGDPRDPHLRCAAGNKIDNPISA